VCLKIDIQITEYHRVTMESLFKRKELSVTSTKSLINKDVWNITSWDTIEAKPHLDIDTCP